MNNLNKRIAGYGGVRPNKKNSPPPPPPPPPTRTNNNLYRNVKSNCGDWQNYVETIVYNAGKQGIRLSTLSEKSGLTIAQLNSVIHDINFTSCGNNSIMVKTFNANNPTYVHAIKFPCQFRYRGAWSC